MTQMYWILSHLFVPLAHRSQAYPGTLAISIYRALKGHLCFTHSQGAGIKYFV